MKLQGSYSPTRCPPIVAHLQKPAARLSDPGSKKSLAGVSKQPSQQRGDLQVAHGVYTSTLSVQGYQVTSPKAWGIMANTLRQNDVKLISQQEISWVKEKGAVLIDIRPGGEYEEGHLEDSINVPLYRLIEGWTPMKALRRAGFAFFGVFNGTEVNPGFNDEIQAVEGLEKLGKDTQIILICQFGGTLEPTVNIANGKQSRALIAAYEILKLGFHNISVLRGGFSEWKRNDRPYLVLEAGAADEIVEE